MRVIAGEAKGRTLLGPKSFSIRPVLDKVKGAIFNILYDVEDLLVLDLFAGTGAMGIEAISRGAREVVFVDSSREAVDIIHQNLKRCRFEDRAVVSKLKIPQDLSRIAARILPLVDHGPLARPLVDSLNGGSPRSSRGKVLPASHFDLIFIDPPYDKGLLNPTLQAVAKAGLLAPDGKIVSEHSSRELPEIVSGLTLTDQRKYGQTRVSFLRKE